MKRLICLLLIFANCILLCSCFQTDDSYTEIWSCIDEFDNTGFDAEKYIADLQNDPNVTVEESIILDSEKDIVEYSYVATFGKKSSIFIDVCYDVDCAKEYYSKQKSITSRIYSPYFSLVRIDNVVFLPIDNRESNLILPEIMNAAGIEEQYLLKIHTNRRLYLKPTDKSLEEIIEEIEKRGYYILYHSEDADIQLNIYSFASDDGRNMYEIIACHHENSKDYVLNYLSIFEDLKNESTVAQIYCTLGNDYSMLFFGNSIDTADFWNEIR